MGMFDFLKRKSSPEYQYELVEHPVDEKVSRQGVRLTDSLYDGMVVTISPNVQLKPENDVLRVVFDFTVEHNPNNIEYSTKDLHSHLGNIIVDIITKDYE